MSSGLNKIFWGLILVFLDFNLGINGSDFDILPNFIGYLNIAYGFYLLKEYGDIKEYVRRGTSIAYVLTGVEVIRILFSEFSNSNIIMEVNIFGNSEVIYNEPNFIAMISAAIVFVIQLILDYYILKIIYVQGKRINNIELVKCSERYFKILAGLLSVNLIIMPAVINFSDVDILIIANVILVAIMFLTNILYLCLVRKTVKIFKDEAVQLEFKI